ncbi:aldo/keto reductase [Persicimonas caeni]|uniref:Aldo/keto reductase n=1 Tax=Persicimonas caeni TaxID=2292766 RepID=A0A4Y6PXT9_PERCE|nr:aldo/keto reductase [Persicimonas caeni]QED33787.1 aldo/keto reductase [Persicimonas caeni]
MKMANDTFDIGGDMTVHRLGFGAMRITGEGIWGWPDDREQAKKLLERVVELGIDFIDTADSYGPEVSEYLLCEALKPYENVHIATKGGLTRLGPREWPRDGRPEHLERAINNSLRRLEVDQIDLYQLHAPDPDVPLEDSLGALKEAQEAGKIRHIGVSNFSVDQIEQAREMVEVVTVQNRYNLGDREHDPVVDYCTEHDIGFIPWYPLNTGELAEDERLEDIAKNYDAKPSQIALAWLLKRSPVMLPIPGTSSIEHLEENTAARDIDLSDEDFETLSQMSD